MGLLGQGHFLEEVFWSAYFLYFTGWRIALLVPRQLSYIAEWYKPASLWEVVLEMFFSWRARGCCPFTLGGNWATGTFAFLSWEGAPWCGTC